MTGILVFGEAYCRPKVPDNAELDVASLTSKGETRDLLIKSLQTIQTTSSCCGG